jgi:hypothetical protein
MSRAFAMHVVMADGATFDVRTNLRDQLRYEESARKGKWGDIVDNLLRYEAFTAWSALERSGQYPGKFDEFADAVEQIDSDVIAPVPTPPVLSNAST